MRILLDENLNWRLKRDLPGHEVESVPLIGWAGIQNGTLLRRAVESGFDVLITMDNNMVHQQDLAAHLIAVLVLRAPSNRLQDTHPLMSAVLDALPNAPKGTRTIIEL
jgi:predicted nuclease of predicted toxin-antitoxin system